MNPSDRVTATIDGREIDVRAGEMILHAANRAGIDIPTLCHMPHAHAEGGCRLCMVEISGQRRQAACHTPLSPGMQVATQSVRLSELRREILRLTASSVPGPFKADPHGTRFERLLHEYGVQPPASSPSGRPIDQSHPYMRFDRDRCITCRLCLNACEQVQGQFVYSIEHRGGQAKLLIGPDDSFGTSGCVACGACVDVCPTGAVSDRDRRAATLPVESVTTSVCGYCGVGCRVQVETADHVVLRIRGVEGAAVNNGHLCVKGRYSHAYHRSPERLTTPLVRDASGVLRPASWREAIEAASRGLTGLRDTYGPDSLGALTSSRSTNEAAYLLQKMFRSLVRTNNVDCCARVCHSSTAVALGLVTGTGAATASFADIERAGLIVVAGANPTEAHPVVGAKIKQAVLRGAKLIVIDPRQIELAKFAHVHIPVWPGGNVLVFNAIAKMLIESQRHDRAYVEARCEGFESLRAFLGAHSVTELAGAARVDESVLRAAADLIGAAGPGLFVSGLGLSEQSQGVAGVMAYCNLGLLTGSLGKKGAGMLPLRGQNNVQGNADMGSQPYALTGYAKLDDAAARERLGRLWGSPPPREVGKTIPEMYDAAVAGSLRGLWIQGEDVVQSDPNHDHVVKALTSLDLLIVQELFMTQTAALAHVVFPAAAVLEQEGTFTNGERRVQHVRPAVDPPGEARPDWEVIRDVGLAMRGTEGWHHATPSSVMREIAAAAPSLFGGINYARLGKDGLQWPCPDVDHPGTSTVHDTGFVRGRALLSCVDYVPPQDAIDGTYPMVLITGRVLEHYNVGTMTRRSPSRELVDRDYLEIHPSDASRLSVKDGAPVKVRSRWGEAVASARLSNRVQPGTSFLTFHFPETRTNCVVGPHVDPISKCPDYKVVAVNLSPA